MNAVILHCDDLGLHPSVNAVIHQPSGYGDGAPLAEVLSFSLLATGDAAHDAATQFESYPNRCIGLHLALTGVKAAAPEAWPAGLLDPDHNMPASVSVVARALFTRRLNSATVAREWLAQLNRFRAFGLGAPTHIDAHQHVHTLPGLSDALIAVARASGRVIVRVPEEPWSLALDNALEGTRNRAAIVGLNASAAWLRRSLHHAGIATTRRAVGFSRSGQMTWNAVNELATWMHETRSAPPSAHDRDAVELYLHPAMETVVTGYRHIEELDLLKSPNLYRLFAARGVNTIRFRDLLSL